MNPAFRPFALASILLVSPAGAADGTTGIAWLGTTEIAAGRGERGPWEQNQSRYDYVDDPTVAIDELGEIALAWVDQVSKDVFFQRLAPEGGRRFSRAVNVSRSPGTFSWLPRLVVAPGSPRQVFLLWQEIIFSGGSHGGDILFAQSKDGGATFSYPRNLSNSVGGDGKGRITAEIWHNGSLDLAYFGADGALYAAWTEYDGALWFSRSLDGGESFSRPRRVGADASGNPARAPALAIGPDRSVYLAWSTGEDPGGDVRVARSNDGGLSFALPQVVAPSPTYSDAPRITVGNDGTLHLVYAESSGGPFASHRILYTRSRDGGGSFDTPREISAPLPEGYAGAGFPALASDAQGRLCVTWELFHAGKARPNAQAFAVSLDGGRTFTPPATVPGSEVAAGGANGSQQGLLTRKLAVNGAGAVAVVNSSLKPDAWSRIWLTRGEMPPAATRRAEIR